MNNLPKRIASLSPKQTDLLVQQLKGKESGSPQATVAREGIDITILAWSTMVPVALNAAETLVDEGIEAKVIDLRTLAPLDVETIVTSVEKTGRAVVVHEAPKTGGVGAEIVSIINEHAFFLHAPPQNQVCVRFLREVQGSYEREPSPSSCNNHTRTPPTLPASR
jgi:pyruvate/2-oxoglutarate/acetoin dehydrogenase E1 component